MSKNENRLDASCCPNLDSKTRTAGFCLSLLITIILFFVTLGSIGGLFLGNIESFVIFYLLTTTAGLATSFFLKGPKTQCQNMKHPSRLLITVILFISYVLAWIFLFVWESKILVIICLSVNFVTFCIYVCSYFDGGKEYCLRCWKTCCCGCFHKENNLTSKEPIL